MNNVRVILKKKKPDDNLGYLRISTRVGKKTKIYSLHLKPINEKHFNSKTQRIRTSCPEHEYYNGCIEKVLQNIEKKGNKHILINDEKKSFIDFVNKVIDRTENQGTSQKYTNIRNLLIDFTQNTYGDRDVKFFEIDVDFIQKFKKWLRERGNTSNSISYKTKCFKSLFNKAIKERIYNFDFNPFRLITNKIDETKVDILNKDELKKLMKTPLEEVYRSKEKFGEIINNEKVLNDIRYKHRNSLDDIRKFFLFQLFCQGIRVSDLITLRWNDFYIADDQIRIKKRMVKTKHYVDILINYSTMEYLAPYIPTDTLSLEHAMLIERFRSNQLSTSFQKNEKVIDKLEVMIGMELDGDYLKDMEVYDYFLLSDGMYYINQRKLSTLIEEKISKLKLDIQYKDVIRLNHELEKRIKHDETIIYLKRLLDKIKSKYENPKISKQKIIDENQLKNYLIFTRIIKSISDNKRVKTKFCFPILRNEDFTEIDAKNDFGYMTQKQYSKFSGGRSYYNKLLKVISVQCGIMKPLKSHLSRHSYTSLMLEIGENLNLFDLMSSLGHKHLNTTQGYIQKFNSKRVDEINKKMSDFLNE